MPLDVARRGTLDVRDPPLKAIVAGNDNYEAGYHKGNAGGLDAIDTDLATANIKNGITIFGKAGSADVFDISDATAVAAEVIDGETFYAVSGGIRTGTMPIVALDPALNEYPAGYHAGEASLTAVDAHLAAGNIKDGVEIFGVTGTFEETTTVTEVRSAVRTTAAWATSWTARWTESIPDSAKKVVAWMGGLCTFDETHEIQITYDGVQKAYDSAGTPDIIDVYCQWQGDGLGSTADLKWEERCDAGAYDGERIAGGWYVS